MLFGGTVVAVWAAPVGEVSPDLSGLRSLLGVVVPLLACLMMLSPERVTPAGRPVR